MKLGCCCMKKNKFNAHAIVIDNIRFDSIVESKLYLQLKQLKKEGSIRDFSLNPSFMIIDPFEYMGWPEKGNKYTADYLITWNDGQQEVIEIKGFVARDFPLRLKLFKSKNPNLKITILREVQNCDIAYQHFFKGFIELSIHEKLVAARRRAKANAKKKAEQTKKGSTKRTKGK